MPQKVIYHSPTDVTPFDYGRYLTSLQQYGDIDEGKLQDGLTELAQYDPLHVSCLVELGVKLIPDEDKAREYYDSYHNADGGFERLRRITGYLVGSLERWNDGKRAEEAERVKHSLGLSNANGVYTAEQKAAREVEKTEHIADNQNEYHK